MWASLRAAFSRTRASHPTRPDHPRCEQRAATRADEVPDRGLDKAQAEIIAGGHIAIAGDQTPPDRDVFLQAAARTAQQPAILGEETKRARLLAKGLNPSGQGRQFGRNFVISHGG